MKNYIAVFLCIGAFFQGYGQETHKAQEAAKGQEGRKGQDASRYNTMTYNSNVDSVAEALVTMAIMLLSGAPKISPSNINTFTRRPKRAGSTISFFRPI